MIRSGSDILIKVVKRWQIDARSEKFWAAVLMVTTMMKK